MSQAVMATQAATRSKSYQTYVLIVFMLVYVSNFADRNIVAVIQEVVKHEFALQDWQLGLLGGTAFAILYSVIGIPIARLAERSNRVNIIAICMTIWSAMTAFCGAANSFSMLVLGRIGVGIGEAGGTPPVHSIISNIFPQSRRAWALSVYSAGMPLGAMVAALAGGWIAQTYGWRAVFFAVGVPGVILALLVKATIAEPERPAASAGEDLTFWPTVRVLFGSGTYRHTLIASVIAAFVNAGIVQFTTSFFIRTHDLSLMQATMIFGVAQGVFATAGTLLGGAIVGTWRERIPGIESWVCTIATATCGFLFAGAFLAGNVWAAVALLMAAKFAQWLYTGPSFSMMQAVAPERGRATAMALYLFFTSLIGAGLGPLLTGLLSDNLAASAIAHDALASPDCTLSNASAPPLCAMARAQGLQWAIVISSAIFIWAAYHFWRAGVYLKREAKD